MNPSLKHEPELVLTQSAANELDCVYTKIGKRIVPFTILLFLMAWLDRYNLGFAKLQMVKDLGFSESVYGFGAGIVYLGYALFEIPSNLYLERAGARQDLCPDHDSLGPHQRCHDVCEDSGFVFHRPLPAGLLRSRVVAGRGPLHDVLVSRSQARFDARDVLYFDAAYLSPGKPRLRLDHGFHEEEHGLCQLAMAVPA